MFKRPERLRGMPDVLPATARGYQEVIRKVQTCFARYGYQPIDVPIVEDVNLFLTKVGEEFIPKLYTFTYRGQTLCLRPEYTSSVCRMFIDHYQRVALPLRFRYAGPVVRHDAPGRARFRQYTQAGVELFGGAPMLADAELLRLASRVLHALGITRYQLVLGHIGIVTELLRQFSLDGFARATLLNNLENLTKPGKGEAYVQARIADLYAGPLHQDAASAPALAGLASDARGALPEHTSIDESARQDIIQETVTLFLHGIGLSFRSREEEEEVVERLTRRLRAPARRDMNRALDFAMELRRCAGPPEAAFPAIRELVSRYQLDAEALAPLEQLVAMLESVGSDNGRITVDLGLGRGLQYYTGLVFEIHTLDGGGNSQLCGGGRYDELVRLLGGPAIPAGGFAFGIERLWLAAQAEGPEQAPTMAPAAMVIPISSADWGLAMIIAERLRALGLDVVVDIKQKGVAAALRRLAKTWRADGPPLAFIVGATERETGTVIVRDLLARMERSIPLSDLESVVSQLRPLVCRSQRDSCRKEE
jgi:histidyl-tRNA synthetase